MDNIKLKILKHKKGFAYFGGEITELPADKASILLNGGYAILIPTIKEEKEVDTTSGKVEVKKPVRKPKSK